MNERQLSLNVPNRWFEKRRDFFVRQMVDSFFTVRLAFQDVYLLYLERRSPGSVTCSNLLDEEAVDNRRQLWDHLLRLVGNENSKGPLWQLKDQCHLVWPEVEHELDAGGSLLDWLVGSIFHETMKLKENMYLLNRYGPAACRIKDRQLEMRSPLGGVVKTSSQRLAHIVDVNGLIRRAAADAVRQMEQVAFLFCHASYILRLKIPALAGNPLVARLLVEREETVRMLWGEGIEDVFADMYRGDAAEGFCTAGRSYMNGQWFCQALQSYQRALSINPASDEAIARLILLQPLVKENKEFLGAV